MKASSRSSLVLALVSIFTLLIPMESNAQWTKLRGDLKYCHKVGKIRVFYNTTGAHAVNVADANKNNIPDQVEDIATQIEMAREIFVKTLKFQDPFKSSRYTKASYVDINMLAKTTIKANGIAYDGLQRFKRSIDDPSTRSLAIDVATSVIATKSITPAHEYFHLIQNGYTFFKTRWYTEGMARWAEHALLAGGVGKIKYTAELLWPQPAAKQTELFGLKYSAEFHLWNPMAKMDDSKGTAFGNTVGLAAKQKTYINGEKVIKDLKLNGSQFMRAVLVRLGTMDDVAFKELGYTKWSEKNQKSKLNSSYIYQAVMDVARDRGRKIGPYKAGQ